MTEKKLINIFPCAECGKPIEIYGLPQKGMNFVCSGFCDFEYVSQCTCKDLKD